MASLVIDDGSPQVAYSPYADTQGPPDLLGGWNPYFSLTGFAAVQGQIGEGTSYHITSLNGAALSIQWHGTAIQLLGNATNASYAITLDGVSVPPNSSVADNSLAYLSGLESTTHNVTLTVQSPGPPSNTSFIAFDEAVILATPADENTSQPTPFEAMSDQGVAFLGEWSLQTSDTQSVAFHQSNTTGDRAAAMFYGTAFVLFGTVSPSSSTYSVTLNSSFNGVTTSTSKTTLSATSSFTTFNTTLFFATGLNASELYSIEVLNVDSGLLGIDVGGFHVAGSGPLIPAMTSPRGTTTITPSYPPGTLAALILAGFLLFLLISSSLFYFFFFRPTSRRNRLRQSRPKRPPQPEEGDVMDISRDVPDESTWRRRFRFAVGQQPGATPLSVNEKIPEVVLEGPASAPATTPRPKPEEEERIADSLASGQQSFTLDLPLVPTFPPPSRLRPIQTPSIIRRSPDSGVAPYFSTAGGLELTDQDIRAAPIPRLYQTRPPLPPAPMPPAIPIPPPPSGPQPPSSPRRVPVPRVLRSGGLQRASGFSGRRSRNSSLLLNLDSGVPPYSGLHPPLSPLITGNGDEDEERDEDDDELEYLNEIDDSVMHLSPRTSEVVMLDGGRGVGVVRSMSEGGEGYENGNGNGNESDTRTGMTGTGTFGAGMSDLGHRDRARDSLFPEDVTSMESDAGDGRRPTDSFLIVRQSSPFRVDFPQSTPSPSSSEAGAGAEAETQPLPQVPPPSQSSQSQPTRSSQRVEGRRRSRCSGQSRVRFRDETETAEPRSGSGEELSLRSHQRPRTPSTPQSILRYTQSGWQPPSASSAPSSSIAPSIIPPPSTSSPPPPIPERSNRRAVVSFLEFGSSSSGSFVTRSSTSDEAGRQLQAQEPKSRWSSTTGMASSGHESGSGSGSGGEASGSRKESDGSGERSESDCDNNDDGDDDEGVDELTGPSEPPQPVMSVEVGDSEGPTMASDVPVSVIGGPSSPSSETASANVSASASNATASPLPFPFTYPFSPIRPSTSTTSASPSASESEASRPYSFLQSPQTPLHHPFADPSAGSTLSSPSFHVGAPSISPRSPPGPLPVPRIGSSTAPVTPTDSVTGLGFPRRISEGAMTQASSTDSVPLSVSDIRFRHSYSDDGGGIGSRRTSSASHLPPHPPLPSGLGGEPHYPHQQYQQQPQRQTPAPPGVLAQATSFFGTSAPGIVERVLGRGTAQQQQQQQAPSGGDTPGGGRLPR